MSHLIYIVRLLIWSKIIQMRIVIISPYRFKAHTKFKKLLNEFTKRYSIIDTEADEFGNNVKALFNNEMSVEIIWAIPENLCSAIVNKYFDVVYIDKDYNEDEVWEIRKHLIGEQKKPIIYF